MGKWRAGNFMVASSNAGDLTEMVSGRSYRELGLHMIAPGSRKGRRPPYWQLTHLGTGHAVCFIDAREIDAMMIATEIAESADWSFTYLDGWKNTDPELKERILGIIAKYPRMCSRGGGTRSEVAARTIAMARGA